MEKPSIEEQLSQLQKRVSYLEGELETSYSEDKFRRFVQRVAFEENEVDIRDGSFGQFARITNINGDEAQLIINRFEDTEYETALTETSEGLGVEIFTDERRA